MNPQEATVPLSTARQAWKILEPYHALIYFAPEARIAYTETGLKGFWMGYFASRAAPLGAVSASVVTATFFNFHPSMVRRAIPDAWQCANPQHILAARYRAADAALRRLLGGRITSASVLEAAELARLAIQGCTVAGRPLFAAYGDLPWPSEPHMILWHAATLLREFRGDGHSVALLAEGLDGCEAHVTQAATGNAPREALQPHRGWSDEEWEAAQTRLRLRGLLDETGHLTAQGRTLRQAVEDHTDLLALPPWQYLGKEKTALLLRQVEPLSDTIVEQGGIPMPNPMGLRWP